MGALARLDQRRFVRFRAAWRVDLLDARRSRSGITFDVSAGGMLVRQARDFSEGSEVRSVLYLPEPARALHVVARVRRVTSSATAFELVGEAKELRRFIEGRLLTELHVRTSRDGLPRDTATLAAYHAEVGLLDEALRLFRAALLR